MSMKKHLKWATALLAAGALCLATLAAQPEWKPLKPKPYPLDKCMVSGEKLGEMGQPFRLVAQDREFLFCCKGCVKDFQKDVAGFIRRHDEAWKKVKPYRADTCIVSGEKLGEMGKPVGFVYQGYEVRLCCKSCRKDFDKEPQAYLEK
ncbi:MAG: hypothetical protein D6766_01550, partial [Verrucomicrobia bacterium]